MSSQPADALIAQLWPHGDSLAEDQVHAIVDSARDPRILPMLRSAGLEYTCLFAGPLSLELQAAAPYLVRLSPWPAFTRYLFELGWGQSWSVLTVVPTHVTLTQLSRHLRTLLRVRDEAGQILMFRFYDPRVLRAYLPTCTPGEAAQVFGPMTKLACESDGAQSLLYFRPSPRGVDGGSRRLADK
ncbi:DUF4123 domain-containing protein [Variovorax sp. ZT5P49]|uniref:DUF4123 domain-containing protein n=1 Tax=Variovorax sp. ZT5P49 TaxID=3443733 RepID=UPI003F45218D